MSPGSKFEQKKLPSNFLLASSGSVAISQLLGWGCRRILQYRRWIFGHLSTKGKGGGSQAIRRRQSAHSGLSGTEVC